MAPPPYPGAADLVLSSLWPQMFAVALDYAPTGPTTWADLTRHVLPYGRVPVAGPTAGQFDAAYSLRLLDTEVTFTHPPGAPPITALGVAVSWADTPEWLIAVAAVTAPAPTSAAGDAVTVPITLVVLADPTSED